MRPPVHVRARTILPAVMLSMAAVPSASAATVGTAAGPFGVAPVGAAELAGVRGAALDRSLVNRMTREQLEAFDRQTAGIMATTFDNWLFDVGLPLIAANLGR